MNEDTTKDLHSKTSFEERVFARFDSVDARFDIVDARLEKLEARSYDTKPIWERALSEIIETRSEVSELSKRLGSLESNLANVTSEFVEFKHDLTRQLTRRIDLVLETMVATRDEMRQAEDRITQLESRLS